MKNSRGLFKKKILIIGASSYVAEGVAKSLANKNYKIIVSSRNKNKIIKNFNCIYLDLNDKKSFKNIPKDTKIIINAACVRKKYHKNTKQLFTNITSALNLSDFINKHKTIEMLIFFSSISVYGNIIYEKINYKTKINEGSLYGYFKFLEEKIYENNINKNCIISIRLPGVIDKKSKYSFLSRVIKKMKKNHDIEIFNKHSFFNNIIDTQCLAELINKILINKKEKNFISFPVGAKDKISLIYIINYIKKKLNSNSKIVNKNDKNKISFVIDNTFIKKKFGFYPSKVLDIIDRNISENKIY